VILAKAPQPGFAKTRLIPALGARGAADLALRLLLHTVNEALCCAIGPVELCVTPDRTDAMWQKVSQRSELPDAVEWSGQGKGDLGARMGRVTQRVIEADESVLLIGADCPDLTSDHLRQAARALLHHDATLFPATDGGYALLGLNRFHPSLFDDIQWGSNMVLFETLRRFLHLGWSVQNHSRLHDIDEPADLKRLPQHWQEERHDYP
jgi:rSAM/selenodomain-associated transferase 1